MIRKEAIFRIIVLLLTAGILFSAGGCLFLFSPEIIIPDPDPYTGPGLTVFDPYFPVDQEEEMLQRLISLRDEATDAAGWIRVPGTEIDFPVVQGSNNAYYLDRDHLEQRTRYGAIFMDYRNRPLHEDRNTILYGHNMKDDRMFGKLIPFKEEEFAFNHPYIELVTEKGYSVWKVFSAHVTSREFYYIYVNFRSDESYLDFLTALQERSMHDYSMQLTAQDRILTLSTCSYEFKDAFFAIHSVLVYEFDFPAESEHSHVPGGSESDS